MAREQCSSEDYVTVLMMMIMKKIMMLMMRMMSGTTHEDRGQVRRVAGAGTGSCSDAAGAEIRVAAQDSSSISHVTVSEYKYVEI